MTEELREWQRICERVSGWQRRKVSGRTLKWKWHSRTGCRHVSA